MSVNKECVFLKNLKINTTSRIKYPKKCLHNETWDNNYIVRCLNCNSCITYTNLCLNVINKTIGGFVSICKLYYTNFCDSLDSTIEKEKISIPSKFTDHDNWDKDKLQSYIMNCINKIRDNKVMYEASLIPTTGTNDPIQVSILTNRNSSNSSNRQFTKEVYMKCIISAVDYYIIRFNEIPSCLSDYFSQKTRNNNNNNSNNNVKPSENHMIDFNIEVIPTCVLDFSLESRFGYRECFEETINELKSFYDPIIYPDAVSVINKNKQKKELEEDLFI